MLPWIHKSSLHRQKIGSKRRRRDKFSSATGALSGREFNRAFRLSREELPKI